MGMNEMIQFFKQISGKLSPTIYAGVQGQSTPQQIAFLRQIQREMKQKSTLDSPLNELRVVVFDLETTGFYPDKGDQVISIGAVRMTGCQIKESETFYSLVHSDLPLSEEISTLTNIQESELRTAPPASNVLIQFIQFIDSDILIAHHANHEQSFMQKMTWELLRTKFNHRIIDTSFLIRLFNPSIKSLPLEEVCTQCEIEVKNRHHALGDAMMTAQIWGYFLQQAQTKGFHTLQEVYEYLAKIG